jgi:hypothetical protein
MLWRKVLTFQTKGIAASWGLPHQRTCPLWKGFWLDGFCGSWTQKCWNRFDLRPVRSGRGGTWAEGLRDRGGGPCPFFTTPWHLSYNWGKARKSQSGYPTSHRASRCANLAVFWGTASAGLLHVGSPRLPGGFSQPSVGASDFRVAGLRGSPHHLTSSGNSRSLLWFGRRRIESPNPRDFACCQRTEVH